MTKKTLAQYRRVVAAAEAALIQAREELRLATQRAGRPTTAIFANSTFVLRSTADRWAFEAESKGERAATAAIAKAIEATRHPGSSSFAHLAVNQVEPAAATNSTASIPETAVSKPTLIVNNTIAAAGFAAPPL
jgi:hypothetical protein